MEVEGTEPHYQIIVDRKGALDDVEVMVEVNEKIFSDEVKVLDNLSKQDRQTGSGASSAYRAKISLVEPQTIARSEGKAVRVVDKRKYPHKINGYDTRRATMNVTQLSVFMENKPGHLQSVLKILAGQEINIITLTIAETSDFGIVRMIVNEPDKAEKALHENHDHLLHHRGACHRAR